VAIVNLYCAEAKGLHLGPGLPGSPDVIDFKDHYATLDDEDDDFARKMSWVGSRGCPPITILTDAEVLTQKAVTAALLKAQQEGRGWA
jgi:hypothetical protein